MKTERLTEKIDNDMYLSKMFQEPIITNRNIEQLDKSHSKIVHKLGQLEDFEEELGIDLITLFKALKNGFVYFVDAKTYEQCEIKYFSSLKEFVILNKRTSHFCELKDYGKTWALTREELENGKE